MDVIDRKNPLPCYYQVYQHLKRRIESNAYKAGEQLPSERVLAEELNVNRFTIRKATEQLIMDGLVYPIRRKGYYVKINRIDVDISADTSYSKIVRENNLTPKVHLLHVRPDYPTAEQREALQLTPEQLIWSIYILRYYDEIPASLTRSYVPLARTPGLDANLKKTLSLYRTLEEFYGIEPVRKSSVCELSYADQKEFRHLAVYQNFPLLQVTSVITDKQGMPVEYCVSKFRSDIVKVSVKLP